MFEYYKNKNMYGLTQGYDFGSRDPYECFSFSF